MTGTPGNKAAKQARMEKEKEAANFPCGVVCFMLDPVEPAVTRWALRRYSRSTGCTGRFSYHNALHVIGDSADEPQEPPHDDPRWPTHCSCGYVFTPDDDDQWQVFGRSLWRRRDSGEVLTLEDMPPGAMWDATWLHDVRGWCGPDGRSLVVRLPNGRDWHIDGRASNCTMPKDDVHKCWVRTGEPPVLTVGKGGNTCAAGAGSILAGNYHGFLRNGRFEP